MQDAAAQACLAARGVELDGAGEQVVAGKLARMHDGLAIERPSDPAGIFIDETRDFRACDVVRPRSVICAPEDH